MRNVHEISGIGEINSNYSLVYSVYSVTSFATTSNRACLVQSAGADAVDEALRHVALGAGEVREEDLEPEHPVRILREVQALERLVGGEDLFRRSFRRSNNNTMWLKKMCEISKV